MTITEIQYLATRAELMKEELAGIIAAEQKYMQFLLEVITESAEDIFRDFGKAIEFRPFWIHYAPKQRGRKPRGTAVPWGEVGEKTVIAQVASAVSRKMPDITFPGLPIGSDLRIATNDALIHFDAKLTGPNDNPHQIVASPYQISGNGHAWTDGIVNEGCTVIGGRARQDFQPQLPPFYMTHDGSILLCLTYFLKVVYTVRDLGDQPLDYLELACVPNGLLLFDGPNYAQNLGLLTPGKDEKTKASKRVRVNLDPLIALGEWRSIKIRPTEAGWVHSPRDPQPLPKNKDKKARPKKRAGEENDTQTSFLE